LKELNSEASKDVGIASQNLIEEVLENLLKVKDFKELDVIDEEAAEQSPRHNEGNESVNGSATFTEQKPKSHVDADPEHLVYLQ